MGNFFGFNIAVRGLYTSQRNLDVIGHNLNNVNTPGYSRQEAIQVAANPLALMDGTGMVGTGAEVTGVRRIRDEYLDYKYWSENDTYGEWETKHTQLSEVQAVFNEPSTTGFTKIMTDFYGSLQELTKASDSPSVRSLVRQRGISVIKYFNNTAQHFEKLQSDLNDSVKSDVENINSLGEQIAQLNRQIYVSELDGNIANDLRDRRTYLVDKLSKLINIDANEVVVGKLPSGQDDKHFVLTISGKALVDHFDTSKLAVVPRANKLSADDVPNLYDVKWEDGNSLNIKSGELKGYLEVRDGNDSALAVDGTTKTPMYKGIPYYMRKLDNFVQVFAKAFNEGIINGTDGMGHADGTGLDGSTGTAFFTMLGADNKPMSSSQFAALGSINDRYSKLTAKNFTVSEDIQDDYNKIATADSTGGVGNIKVLNSLLAMRSDIHMFKEGAPEDYMKSLVSTIGIDVEQAENFSGTQTVIINQVENRRASTSGVLIDEEMANLIKFQQAYNASAHMITTMAEVYDTLINKLGV